MKNSLIILLSLVLVFSLSSLTLAQEMPGDFKVKAELDFLGSHEDDDVDTGFSLTGEYMFPETSNMQLRGKELAFGAGLTYQLPRALSDNSNREFNFTTLYGTAHYELQQDSYFIGQLGYNMLSGNDNYENQGDVSGGLYYALGMGMNLQDQFDGEILYSVNNGSVGNSDVSYSKLTFGVSYTFE